MESYSLVGRDSSGEEVVLGEPESAEVEVVGVSDEGEAPL